MVDEVLSAEIDPSSAVELLQRLVRIPSHPGVPRQEARVARELSVFLQGAGLEVELVEVRDGRPNLMCSVSGRQRSRHLLLCGHTDTVPLNVGEPGYGFSGKIAKGRVRGRGAVDMKGALVAMASALVALHRSGRLGAGRVTMAAVIDEEMESLGAEHLIASGFRADGAIVGEPTGNLVCLGHKGLEWLEFEFHGRAAHGGTPDAGINAIIGASRFIELVRSELIPRFEERQDPLVGPPTLNFGTIQGGDQPSTVAAHCSLTADRRSVPGEDFVGIRTELESLLRQVEDELPGLSATVRRVPGGMATLEHVALKTDPCEAIVAAVSAARRSETGSVGGYEAFPAWTDGALLAAFGAIPTVILGPGDLAVAHSPREEIEVEQVLEAARLYAATTVEFCGLA